MSRDPRRNPYGLGSNTEPSHDWKLQPRTVTSYSEAEPSSDAQGLDVGVWASVHVAFYGDPSTFAGVTATIRAWRYLNTAERGRGAGQPEGRWVLDSQFDIPIDPDAALNGQTQHPVFDTRNCDKMYFQVVSVSDDSLSWLVIQPYGYTRKDDPQAIVVSAVDPGSSSGGGSTETAEAFDKLAHGMALYSSLRGEFVVARASATTITLTGLPEHIPEIQAANIVAIALKPAGTAEWKTRWRGKDLECSYSGGTITVPASWPISATDEVAVYFEGPVKGYNAATDELKARTTNPDSTHVAVDGKVIDVSVEDAGAYNEYFAFSMAEDGFHALAVIILGSGGVGSDFAVTLEGTNDPYGDNDCVWQDITVPIFGLTSIGYLASLTLYPLNPIHYRRCRWHVSVTEAGEGGLAYELHQVRSARPFSSGFTGVHNTAVFLAGQNVLAEAKNFDGAALPNSVAEGAAVRLAATRHGVGYAQVGNADGSKTVAHEEDAAHTSGDLGIPAWAVRNDAGAVLAGTDLDYIPLSTDADGNLRTTGAVDLATHDSAVIEDGPQTMLDARSVLPAPVATGDAVRALADLYGRLMGAAHTIATQSDRTEEIDPLSEHHFETALFDETLAGGEDFYFDMDGFRYFAITFSDQFTSGSYTLKVWATTQDDGTVDTGCTYVDVTSDWFGAATFTVTHAGGPLILERDTPASIKYVWVEITAASCGGDAAAWLKKVW